MKRKSAQDRPAKRKKSSDAAPTDVLVRQGDGFTHVDIPPGKSAIFFGAAVLEVVAGCISVYGCLITPERGAVKLTAPSKYGRALLLPAIPAESQAPLAQSTTPAQAVLHTLTQDAAGAAAGFTVQDSSSSNRDGSSPAVWQVPQQWSQAAEALTNALAATAAAADGQQLPPPVAAVTGSKGSGKSAMARLLVNSLLNSCREVAFMDLDPGQPELTPPGLLSLHIVQQPLFGPAHMQQQQPLLAYFQGDVSSQSEPGRYLQAVQALCDRYYSMAAAAAASGGQPPVPLVINTPGWITGLGLELLSEVLRCAQPTHVISMQLPNSKKNLPDGPWWIDAAAAAVGAALPAVWQLPSVAADNSAAAATSGGAAGSCYSIQSGETGTTANPSSSGKIARTLSAVESRALSWLAWSQRVTANAGSSSTSSADRSNITDPASADEFASAAAGLAAAVPYEVSLDRIHVQLLHAQVDRSEIGIAINGAIVGLGSSGQQQQQQGFAGTATLQECLGLGLVRAVDARRGVLYLLTDISEEQLELVDTLVVGRLEFPEKLLVTQKFASPYQGLYCLTSTATGAGVIKARNNLLRASLLRA